MRMTFTSEVAGIRIMKIQHLLRGQMMTVEELGGEIHITQRWMRAYVVHLHKKGQIHIAGWRKQNINRYTTYLQLYAWGSGDDVARPAGETKIERQRRVRAELVADELAHAASLAKRRAKRVKPARDWAASWIPTRQGEA